MDTEEVHKRQFLHGHSFKYKPHLNYPHLIQRKLKSLGMNKGKKGKIYSKFNLDIKVFFLPEDIDEKSMFQNILFNT